MSGKFLSLLISGSLSENMRFGFDQLFDDKFSNLSLSIIIVREGLLAFREYIVI